MNTITPGDWSVSIPTMDSDAFYSVEVTTRDQLICTVAGADISEAVANAALIAAAPAMRAALEKLLQAAPMQQGERSGNIMGTISQAIDLARAALAAAEPPQAPSPAARPPSA